MKIFNFLLIPNLDLMKFCCIPSPASKIRSSRPRIITAEDIGSLNYTISGAYDVIQYNDVPFGNDVRNVPFVNRYLSREPITLLLQDNEVNIQYFREICYPLLSSHIRGHGNWSL